MIKLFCELVTGDWFHFYGDRGHLLFKVDDTHYNSLSGKKIIHPHVAVEYEPPASIFKRSNKDGIHERNNN